MAYCSHFKARAAGLQVHETVRDMHDKQQLNQLDLVAAFQQIATQRRSVRGFLPRLVPQAVLETVFSTALTAPSNCNTQPWITHVVSGQCRDQISDSLLSSVGAGDRDLDFPENGPYQGVYRQRQVEVGVLLYNALGIGRDDREGRQQAFLNNLKFFGAPHAAFLFMPDWCGIREAVDVGLYAQNLMLAMESHGIASCPQTILGFHSSVVRQQLGIDKSLKLLFGISFGYADNKLPQNQIRASRASLSDQVTFHH